MVDSNLNDKGIALYLHRNYVIYMDLSSTMTYIDEDEIENRAVRKNLGTSLKQDLSSRKRDRFDATKVVANDSLGR